MKLAFARHTGGTLRSALVPLETPQALNLGDRITATGVWDMGPDARITVGERGVVAHVDPRTGSVEVLMHKKHKGLAQWDNHVLLVPYSTEDILACLTCSRASRCAVAWRRTPKVAKVGASAALASCAMYVAYSFAINIDGPTLAALRTFVFVVATAGAVALTAA